MLKIIDNFKKLIRFVVTIFASREFAFIYCLVGTLTQITHTYYLAEIISSFSEGFKIFQAVLLSTFISSSLLYFVSIADGTESKENRKIMLAVNIFMIIEILINLYYYSRHLIIDAPEMQIFDFIFAVLIACLIPVTLKLYASTIKAKEWFEEMTHKENNEERKPLDFSGDQYKELITNTIQEYINKLVFEDNNKIQETVNDYLKNNVSFDYNKLVEELRPLVIEDLKTVTQGNDAILKDIDTEVAKIFEKNQKLFLAQFENKIKMLIEKSKSDTVKLGPSIIEHVSEIVTTPSSTETILGPSKHNPPHHYDLHDNIGKSIIEEAVALNTENKAKGIDAVAELNKRLNKEIINTATFTEEDIDNVVSQ